MLGSIGMEISTRRRMSRINTDTTTLFVKVALLKMISVNVGGGEGGIKKGVPLLKTAFLLSNWITQIEEAFIIFAPPSAAPPAVMQAIPPTLEWFHGRRHALREWLEGHRHGPALRCAPERVPFERRRHPVRCTRVRKRLVAGFAYLAVTLAALRCVTFRMLHRGAVRIGIWTFPKIGIVGVLHAQAQVSIFGQFHEGNWWSRSSSVRFCKERVRIRKPNVNVCNKRNFSQEEGGGGGENWKNERKLNFCNKKK